MLSTRKLGKSTLYEVELKRIFAQTNLNSIPDTHLNECLRGMDHLNVPNYDWECGVMAAFKDNLNYLESIASFNTMKANNLTLLNTVFNNVDPPQIRPKPAKKRFI